MDILPAIDRYFFLVINHLPHTELTDSMAQFISGVGSGGLVWLILSGILFIREEKHNHRFLKEAFGILIASWFGVEMVLKYLFARSRPTEAIGAIIVGNGASWFSFPSSHATIAWAFYVLLSRQEPAWKPYLFVLASLVSLSRIYLGVHYPFDILCGGLIGWGIGTLIVYWGELRHVPLPKQHRSVRSRRR